MHTNQFLDFLMGAEDFASLLRRIQGVNDIMNYDKKSLEELKTLMDQLNADKEQLNVEKEELEVAKTDVESKKRQVVSLKATAELAQKEYEQREMCIRDRRNPVGRLRCRSRCRDRSNSILSSVNPPVFSDVL